MTRCTRGRRRVQFWRRAANFFSRSPLQQLSPFFPNSGHLRFATYGEFPFDSSQPRPPLALLDPFRR